MMSVKKWGVMLRDAFFATTDSIFSSGLFQISPRYEEKLSNEDDGIVQKSCTKEKAILLIRLDAIGDFVVGLDAAAGLREYYSDAEITLVGNVLWADLAERVPYFDRVISIDPNRFRHDLSYRYERLQGLRQPFYQTAIHLVHNRTGRFADAEAIMRAVQAERKIASTGDRESNWRVRWGNRWYTHILPVEESGMELRRNAQFVRALGARDFQSSLPTLPREVLPPVEDLPDNYYVLFPGAGAEFRQWPARRFAEIAERLDQGTGWTGVVCGGPGEEELGKQLSEMAEAGLEEQIGQTGITELASVLAGAKMLIGNETSAVHLATAVATPSICILGGGHHGRFVPYDVEHRPPGRPVPQTVTHEMPCFNCDWDCCFNVPNGAPKPCIDRISVESVWQCVREVTAEIVQSTANEKDERRPVD